MPDKFKIVDIFAGPGGLAEGFSRVVDKTGNQPFEMALSLEMEQFAHSTLTLRNFLRHFPDGPPSEYYDFIRGEITKTKLYEKFDCEFRAAAGETLQRKLGAEGVQEELNPLLDTIRDGAAGNVILVGGPPCQAYSLVGRARNKGISNYVARDDHRHFLYKEYIRILARLRPAAFVMENVKGLLSAKVDGLGIFDLVLDDLRRGGLNSPDVYELFPLKLPENGAKPSSRDFIVCAEKYGVPQRRHRVIVVGIRKDILASRPAGSFCEFLEMPQQDVCSAGDILDPMPALRSGLSRRLDVPEEWRSTAISAFRDAAKEVKKAAGENAAEVAHQLLANASRIKGCILPPRKSNRMAKVSNRMLSNWILDPNLDFLPNHDTRSHMPQDLSRYAFVTTFGQIMGRSPKSSDFPRGLAPNHRSWSSGKFADRFKVQLRHQPSSTITSHISKDGHYFIHPIPEQCRSLTVREAARLQTFPDNYHFEGNRTQQYIQVGNAVPPYLATQIGVWLSNLLRSNQSLQAQFTSVKDASQNM